MHLRLARDLFVSTSLVVLVLTTYFGAWDKEFVYFDDPGYVTDNLNIQKGLTPDSIYWSFTAFEQSNWHPLTWISHQTDIQIYGLKNPGGHHVTNLVLHTFNVLLVFWLFRLLTGNTWCCAAIAAFFAVHPMHVESVIWVAERKDVLSTFLGLLTFIVYMFYARKADFKPDTWITVAVITMLIGFLAITWFGLQCYKGDEIKTPIGVDNSTVWIFLLLGSVFISGFAAVAYSVVAGRPHVLLYYVIFILFVLGLLAKPMLVTLPCVCLLFDFWPLNRMFGTATATDLPMFTFGGSGGANDDDEYSGRRSPPADRAAMRRKLRRNQKLPGGNATAVRRRPVASSSQSYVGAMNESTDFRRMAETTVAHVVHAVMLAVEKLPLFALSIISSIITPYAQKHGGSMATAQELPFAFRVQNAIQAYCLYLRKMVWPGPMTSLYLLDRPDKPALITPKTILCAAFLVLVTSFVIWTLYTGRRYIAFGWFWYIGILVPVIGLVQVGEQAIADRYTYVPYIGIFLIIAFACNELFERLDGLGRAIASVLVTLLTVGLLVICVDWSWFQENFWRNAEAHLDHALSIYPENWNMLNNKGVKLWEHSAEAEGEARKAAAEGHNDESQKWTQTSEKFKEKAIETWEKGIRSRNTATDIHSNLGYAYSEKATKERAAGHMDLFEKYLTMAQQHLEAAVYLKDISPRPRNNLGRVYLVRAEAAEANKKPDEAKKFKAQAIYQFQEAIRLDPTLLEAHANLAQVYFSMQNYNGSESEYKAMLSYWSANSADEKRQTFASAWLGLYQIASVRQKPKEMEAALINAINMCPVFLPAHKELAKFYLDNGRPAEAELQLWVIMHLLPPAERLKLWTMFAGPYFGADPTKLDLTKPSHPKEAATIFTLMAWALATSPTEVDRATNQEYSMRNGPAAVQYGQLAVGLTGQQDPRAIDALAAARAENGQFSEAIQAGNFAADLAQRQNNAALAAEIRSRVAKYTAHQPYRCNPDGTERP